MLRQWLLCLFLYFEMPTISYGQSLIESSADDCQSNPQWNPIGSTIFGGYGQGPRNLNYPSGIFIEPNTQILYVADTGNHRIQKRYPNGTIVTAAGNDQTLSYPQDMIADENENILVVDSDNHRIVYFEKDSKQGRTVAGNTTQGSSLGELSYPSRITVTSKKDLIIADTYNHRIMQWSYPYNSTNSTGKIIAGGHGAGLNMTQLNSPTGLFYQEQSDFMYISNQASHSIFEWIRGEPSAHRIVAGISGNPGPTAYQLNNPKGISLDQDRNLYIADSENNRIQRFCLYSMKGITIAGTGAPGNSDAQLNGPSDIAFDAAFNLYVVDTNNSRVQRFERIE